MQPDVRVLFLMVSVWTNVVCGDCSLPAMKRTLMAVCSKSQLQDVPNDFYNKIKIFDLGENSIHTLSNSSFLSYRQLTDLYLNSNELSFISAGAFAGLDALVSLFLNNNNLTSVPTLTDLVALRQLDLRFNRISSLHEFAFQGAVNLRTILLSSSNILHVSPKAFHGLGHLQYLNMSSNHLTTFPESHFPPGVTLDLDGNPLDCSCSLIPFISWVSTNVSHGVVLASPLKCASPPRRRNHDISTVVKAMSECAPTIAGVVSLHKTFLNDGQNDLVSLNCRMCGSPLPVLTWSSDPMTNGTDSNIIYIVNNSCVISTVSVPRRAGKFFCIGVNAAGSAVEKFSLMKNPTLDPEDELYPNNNGVTGGRLSEQDVIKIAFSIVGGIILVTLCSVLILIFIQRDRKRMSSQKGLIASELDELFGTPLPTIKRLRPPLSTFDGITIPGNENGEESEDLKEKRFSYQDLPLIHRSSESTGNDGVSVRSKFDSDDDTKGSETLDEGVGGSRTSGSTEIPLLYYYNRTPNYSSDMLSSYCTPPLKNLSSATLPRSRSQTSPPPPKPPRLFLSGDPNDITPLPSLGSGPKKPRRTGSHDLMLQEDGSSGSLRVH